MPFFPGHQYGAKGQRLTRALERALAADNWRALHNGCDRIAAAFEAGEPWAISLCFDRLEGKAIARIESTSTDARGLDLQTVVQAVLAARSAQSEDAQIVNTNHSTNENHSHLALESAQPDSSETTPTP